MERACKNDDRIHTKQIADLMKLVDINITSISSSKGSTGTPPPLRSSKDYRLTKEIQFWYRTKAGKYWAINEHNLERQTEDKVWEDREKN